MKDNLIYIIKKEEHNKESLINLIEEHKEIKFVSLMGVDLIGNSTDERIPIKVFINDIDNFLNGIAVQTDGSSVNLPGISTLNDAKVDMAVDLDVNWVVDYNYSLMDSNSDAPVGTILIPCFLYHNNKPVDSRSILKTTVEIFKQRILKLLKDNDTYLEKYEIKKEEIKDIVLTTATELEFWVKTPNDKAEIDALTTSQRLNEQYWNRIDGVVRTALEDCLITMDKYNFEPEMGHKEVGGVKPKLGVEIRDNHIMEQLEIDWKYSNPMQTADNEAYIKELTSDIFKRYGLETTFLAKPIKDVAGNGMHTHLGIAVELNDGKVINLFNSTTKGFLSELGYGALMGILHNYEVINPFISSSRDSLNRLKPGYEAPVSIVTSLGTDENTPSRNRSVLIGLVRDNNNPKATRFELRSPNPGSNLYVTVAVCYLAMLDGIEYVFKNQKTEEELLKEISKKSGEDAEYLEKEREYRSEEDVFEAYTEEYRNKVYGISPRTVYENIRNLDNNSEKMKIFEKNMMLDEKIINSIKASILNRWRTEITHRVIKEYREEIIGYIQNPEYLFEITEQDEKKWEEIKKLKVYISKNTEEFGKCLFAKILGAFEREEYELASNYIIELEEKMEELRKLYNEYIKNLL